VVLAAHGEQQRRPVVQVVVDPGLLVARLPVGYQAVGPHPAAGRRDVEAVVRSVGLLPTARVGERIVELLPGEAHRAVPVGRVGEDREQGLDLGRRVHPHTLGWRRVDRHGGGAQSSVDQELGEGPAEGVAHDDRRTVQALDHVAEMVEGFGEDAAAMISGFSRSASTSISNLDTSARPPRSPSPDSAVPSDPGFWRSSKARGSARSAGHWSSARSWSSSRLRVVTIVDLEQRSYNRSDEVAAHRRTLCTAAPSGGRSLR
jgi:hypothetical protein